MTREEAIEILRNPPYEPTTIHHDFEYIATKLDISIDELNEYFSMPKKTYSDFKSQAWVYHLGSNIMKYLGMEVGGKR
jgi:hypothetical protein